MRLGPTQTKFRRLVLAAYRRPTRATYCIAFNFICDNYGINSQNNALFFTGGDNFAIQTNGKLLAGATAQTNAAITTGQIYRVIAIGHANSVTLYLNGTAQTTLGTDATFGHLWRVAANSPVESGGHGGVVVFDGKIGTLLVAQNNTPFSWSVADLDAALLARC